MSDVCDESFLRLIAHTGLAMRSYADQQLKSYGLTVEQLQVLKQTDLRVGLPQRTLSVLTGKSPANITRILDRLEKKERIVRKANPDDRRSSLVFLTGVGKILSDEVTSLFEGLQSELVGGINIEKQIIAFEVLTGIKNNIGKMSEK